MSGSGTICIWERGGGGQFAFGREGEGDDLFANVSEGDGENLHLGESGRTICICERAGVGRFVFGREGRRVSGERKDLV